MSLGLGPDLVLGLGVDLGVSLGLGLSVRLGVSLDLNFAFDGNITVHTTRLIWANGISAISISNAVYLANPIAWANLTSFVVEWTLAATTEPVIRARMSLTE